jgi:hypothetical protein
VSRTDAGTSDAASKDASVLDGGDRDGEVPDREIEEDGGFSDGGLSDGGIASGPCPDYIGFRQIGQSWTLESNAASEAQNGATWTQRIELVAMEDRGDHFEVRTSYHQEMIGSSYTSSTDGTVSYRCDSSGYSILRQSFDSTTTTSGGSTFTTAQVDYAPPLLLGTSNPQVGDSWSTSSLATTAGTSNGTPYSNTSNISSVSTVLGPGSVTVPAGNFPSTLRIHVDWGSSSNILHFVEPIGLVADDYSELASYR